MNDQLEPDLKHSHPDHKLHNHHDQDSVHPHDHCHEHAHHHDETHEQRGFGSWAALGSIIGFIGNELVAMFHIQVGRKINAAALIADSLHARTDGLTSLAILAGVIGVWLGFPLIGN